MAKARREAEEALRRAEIAESNQLAAAEAARHRLEELFRQAPAAIVLLRGPEHVFELVNPAAAAILGRNREIEGKGIREALPELEGRRSFDVLDRVFQSGEPFVGNEVPMLRDPVGTSATEKAFLNLVCQPVRDAAGNIDGIFVHAVDVTEQVHAHEEIETARAHLAAVIEQMPCGVVIADAPSGRLILGNQQVDSLWRLPFLTSAAIGQYDQYLGFHPDGRRYAVQEWPLARSLSGEVIIGEEIEVERGDGSPHG